ncbi:hypothetical protein ACI1US_00476 [Leucobacter sp. BZR 635]
MRTSGIASRLRSVTMRKAAWPPSPIPPPMAMPPMMATTGTGDSLMR